MKADHLDERIFIADQVLPTTPPELQDEATLILGTLEFGEDGVATNLEAVRSDLNAIALEWWNDKFGKLPAKQQPPKPDLMGAIIGQSAAVLAPNMLNAEAE